MLSTLESAGIPGSTIELSIINQGNTEAGSVRLEIETANKILATWSEPSEQSKPIWVGIPKLAFSPSEKKLQAEIKQLATTKPLRIFVGYKYAPNDDPKITVFSTGQPAILVADIDSIPQWSKWNVFRLPAYVFLGGVGFIVLWSLIVALVQNPSFRNALFDALIDATHIGYAPNVVANLIADALSQERKKKDEP